MVTTPQKLTASETVLLAAADLTAVGNQEFSEWDLTVAAWALDRLRFGLRGYAQTHPDHKRVMMEIMGKKASSPVQQKYLEKTRPNHYRLTPLGKAIAAGLRSSTPPAAAVAHNPGKPAPKAVLPTVTRHDVDGALREGRVYVSKPEFRRWQDNPEEPRLGRRGEVPGTQRHGPAHRSDRAARRSSRRDPGRARLVHRQDTVYLTRGGNAGSPIHVSDLANVLDFLVALTYRFPECLRSRGAAAEGEEGRGQAKEADLNVGHSLRE